MPRASRETYCVDGTNLVRGAYGYGGPDFREQEDADGLRLVAALAEVCLRIGDRIEIDVFFDGASRPWSLPGSPSNMRVCFGSAVPADDLIMDRVRLRRYGGGKVTVVTADGELGQKVSEEGGRWLKLSRGFRMEGVVSSIERRFA